MKRWFMFVLFFLIIALLPFQVTVADNESLGWVGHDIYFLNSFDIRIANKNIKIEIEEDKLNFSGEYIINNESDKIVEVVLGLPSDNVDNLIINDKGNNLKFYKRNNSYIEKNYSYVDLPKAEKWSTVSLWLKQNESRLINIKYESNITNDNKGIYKIRYSNNIGLYGSEISKTLIVFNNFKPYNILHTFGIDVEDIFYSKGSQLICEGNGNSQEIRIDYELTDKLAVDRLDFSTSKKLKNIANLYRLKDYEAVITSCDEYLANPTDSSIDKNQVEFIKAEALRQVVRFDKYLEIIKNLNFDKLYPDRLKYKILFDMDEIFNGKVDELQLFDAIKMLQEEALDKNEFIGKWMIYNNKRYLDANENIESKGIREDDSKKEESLLNKYISLLKLNKIFSSIIGFKYFNIIGIVVVFFVGFFLGRKSRKRRKNIPYYTFKR